MRTLDISEGDKEQSLDMRKVEVPTNQTNIVNKEKLCS